MLESYYEDIFRYIDIGRTATDKPISFDFHLHNNFEIYFFISGDVNYFIEKKVYTLKYGDLLIINSHEIHKPSFKSNAVYERIVIHFDPLVVRLVSSPTFDLLKCFKDRPIGENNKIALKPAQIDEILKLLQKIEYARKNNTTGSDVLTLAYFMELLVFINRVFMSPEHIDEYTGVPEKLIPILDFIEANLDCDLSLEILENKFYINRFYLSRLFKKSIGSGIHEYILIKRISKAKKLLSDGLSVTDTCMQSGFSDYSNFIRMFKKTTGLSPGQYKKEFPIYDYVKGK